MTYRQEIDAILDAADASDVETNALLRKTQQALDEERAGRNEDKIADTLEDTAYEGKIASLTADKAALEAKLDELLGNVAGWTKVLEDQFLGPLDTTRWTALNGYGNSNEHSFLRAQNVTTKDGLLRIQAKLEEAGGRHWTSGYLHSNENKVGKFLLPNYFRAEVRAKLPWEKGMWGAPLWFRPSDSFGAYEIDAVEHWANRYPRVDYTVHGGASYSSADHKQYSLGLPLQDPDGWHVWTVEKTKGKIQTFCDGKLVQSTTADSRSVGPFFNTGFENPNRKWDLRCNLQVGDNQLPEWTGGDPDSTTDWSNTTLQVDYIKAWKTT